MTFKGVLNKKNSFFLSFDAPTDAQDSEDDFEDVYAEVQKEENEYQQKYCKQMQHTGFRFDVWIEDNEAMRNNLLSKTICVRSENKNAIENCTDDDVFKNAMIDTISRSPNNQSMLHFEAMRCLNRWNVKIVVHGFERAEDYQEPRENFKVELKELGQSLHAKGHNTILLYGVEENDMAEEDEIKVLADLIYPDYNQCGYIGLKKKEVYENMPWHFDKLNSIVRSEDIYCIDTGDYYGSCITPIYINQAT